MDFSGFQMSGVIAIYPSQSKLIYKKQRLQGIVHSMYVSGFSCTPVAAIPVNTKHLYNICAMLGQRRRRRADFVQMLGSL